MEFLILASIHFLTLLSPGPDFFLILQSSLRLRRRTAIAVCLGIGSANALYITLAIVGFEILRKFPPLTMTLKYAGSVYLIYVGYHLLKAPMTTIENGPGSTSFVHKDCFWRQFLIGFMSGFLNPKNIIFYLSIFTVMVSEETGILMRSLYGLWMVFIVVAWDILVCITIGNQHVKNRLGKAIYYVEKLAGCMLVGFALYVVCT